jgi:hypothetical protein
VYTPFLIQFLAVVKEHYKLFKNKMLLSVLQDLLVQQVLKAPLALPELQARKVPLDL